VFVEEMIPEIIVPSNMKKMVKYYFRVIGTSPQINGTAYKT
jgi:hypothetical protein